MWGELSDSPKFYLDNQNYCPDKTLFFMRGNNLKYLLCFLNSKICTWMYDKLCTKSGMGTRMWNKTCMERLYIPSPNESIRILLENETTSFQSLDTIFSIMINELLELSSQEQAYIRDLELAGF